MSPNTPNMPASEVSHATFETAGVFRCCFEGLPFDDGDRCVVGADGEVRSCPHCKRAAYKFDASANTWRVQHEH